MPLDIDTGFDQNETQDMRAKRERTIASSPKPEFFKLRAQLLDQGRDQHVVAKTDNMEVCVKVYASGGENGLHNHTDEDHFHLVLAGKARFYGPRGEEHDCGMYEGIMLPAGSFYRFHAVSDEPLVLLRVGCDVATDDTVTRNNIYGDPIPGKSKANGEVAVVKCDGEFWGAAE
jgi:mannose-6-phosphate isomerase-like protein (cupin superfamily)